jgi:hypothetical protein
MEQNKVRSYLFYAIGEIALVVIGILLALQVNNWNEHRKQVQTSRGYLVDMRSDLIADTLELGLKIRVLEKVIDAEKDFLSKTEYSIEDMSRLDNSGRLAYFDFYIHDNTYLRIQNSGSAQLTGFEELNGPISNYYSEVKLRATKNNEFEVREATRQTRSLESFMANVDLIALSVTGLGPDTPSKTMKGLQSTQKAVKAYLKHVNTVEYRNELFLDLNRHVFIINGFEAFYNDAVELLNQIDMVLNN